MNTFIKQDGLDFYKTTEALEANGWVEWFIDFGIANLEVLAPHDIDTDSEFRAFCLDTGKMLTIEGYNAFDIYRGLH